MSLESLALRVLLPSFSGTTVPDHVLRLLEEGRRVPVDEAIADGVALTA